MRTSADQTYHNNLSHNLLNNRKNEIMNMYQKHFISMIKHLKQQIFYQELKNISEKE